MAGKTALLASAIDRLNMTKRILGLLRLGGRAWREDVYLTFKLRVNRMHFRVPAANPTRRWFSTVSEKQFRGRQLERRASIEPMARLPVAR